MSDGMLTVQSDVMVDGSYGVTIDVTDDRAFSLTRQQAVDYAVACYGRATAADHTVGVLRLLTDLGVSEEHALGMLTNDLSPRQPRVDGTDPMAYTVTIGRRHGDYVALLDISHHDHNLGVVTPSLLREHASAVLDTLAAVDLDGALHTALVSRIGLDDGRARAVVASLGNYIPTPEQ